MAKRTADTSNPVIKKADGVKAPGPEDKMSVTLVFKSGAVATLEKVSYYEITFAAGYEPDIMCNGLVFTRNKRPVLLTFNSKGAYQAYSASDNKMYPFTPNTLVDAIIFNNV